MLTVSWRWREYSGRGE
uniref:Uncharacterized protein n=1 Tax=Anguilla anguilla TaxID=7936 RepID=A0A0E9RI77_ANGAN